MVKSRIEGLSVQSGLLSHVEDALKKKERVLSFKLLY